MDMESTLLERLKEYGLTDYYPFHMPGHKRQTGAGFAKGFPNPFSIDITEVHGFDNLHHPKGILKESMKWAASVYGSDKTYYLVNGSSAGILSAICGTTNNSDTILLSRNCHKSAYHGVFLNHLRAKYIYPQKMDNFCVQGGLLPDDVEKMLKTHVDIRAICVVSPTYDGIISNIKEISKISHKYNIPLIVDEAHGAHLRYGEDFPTSALEMGADVVIQSVHKTMPSFTQTALLHVNEGYVDIERIERYLEIYQSSSPSYLFMAGIENAIRWMEGEGRQQIKEYSGCLGDMRKRLGEMRHLRLLDESSIGKNGVYDLDPSKIVISTRGTGLSGSRLDHILRESYHLEMEMHGVDYVTAITTASDTKEGLWRLEQALREIDEKQTGAKEAFYGMDTVRPQIYSSICEALNGETQKVLLRESIGRVSAEYVYVYPPGIPIVAPGEILQQEIIETIITYQQHGLPVQGAKDQELKTIEVLMEKREWEN